jgi:hypothetical protein
MGGRRLVHAIVLMYTLRLPPSRTSPSLPASLPHSGVMSSESRGGRACSRRASAHRSLTKVIQRGGDVDACDPASTGSGAQLGQEDPAGMRIGEMAHCHFGSTAGRPTSCASRRAASHWSLVTAAILACHLPLASKLKTHLFQKKKKKTQNTTFHRPPNTHEPAHYLSTRHGCPCVCKLHCIGYLRAVGLLLLLYSYH